MEELGIGADPQRTMNVMANAIQLRNENADYEYGLLTGGKSLDFSKMNVIGSTPKKKKKTFFRAGPDGIYREYETEKE